MNPNEKKEEQVSSTPPNNKLQRKLKFKTLDGKITHLECDYDIKISDLKKKLEKIYNIEPNRQRLLNKGKQFKDDEYLDKLVDKDDTTIHLVFRSEEDVRRAQENAKNNNTSNQNTNTSQNTQNINPFQNIISVVTNPDQMRSFTSTIVNQLLGQNANSNNNNPNTNNNNSNTINTINIQPNTTIQTLNVGETLNLNTSPLQQPHSSSNSQNPPSLQLNNNTTSQNNLNDTQNNNNLYSSQFPITVSPNDKKYEMHLKNIEKELNEADKIMSQDIEPKIPLPLLNTTQNVFTAISRSIRKYVIVNQNILTHLMRLADLMEREQFITEADVRMNGNKLLDQAYKSLAHVSKASNDLSNVIKSSNFNTAPNTGYIGIICQEIGLQSMAIGDLNNGNILSTLRGRNNNPNSQNNLNSNINMTTINLNNLGSNTNNNQNQLNSGGTTVASIPISISVIDSSQPPLNINNANTNNNQQATNNQITNHELKQDNIDKKEDEKKQENNNNNNNNINNSNATPTTRVPNNINNNRNNNNDFNNIFGSVVNQIMTPENINSISQAVESMINDEQGDQNSSLGGLNLGNLIGNIVNSLGGIEGLNTSQNPPSRQQSHPNQQSHPRQQSQPNQHSQTNQQSQPNQQSHPNQQSQPSQQSQINQQSQLNQQSPQTFQEIKKTQEKKEPEINSENLKIEGPIFKNLVENEQLRKEIKVGNKKIMGQEMEPNIEFATFSNDIISNLNIQEIFDMYNLHFTGLCRMRKDINSKYFSDKAKNDEIIKKVIEIICERFILIENQLDKLIPEKEFIFEDFFNKELREIIKMFIDDTELNLKDEKWEEKFRKLVINMLINLTNEIKNLYESGEEGAKTFMECNIGIIIENLIGQKYLNAIQEYDDNLMNNFIENIFNIIRNEENKNKCKCDKKENEEKKNENENNNNLEGPNDLSIDEIFILAKKDKERKEKEDKEKPENKENQKDVKKFSEFYHLTSLFQ